MRERAYVGGRVGMNLTAREGRRSLDEHATALQEGGQFLETASIGLWKRGRNGQQHTY